MQIVYCVMAEDNHQFCEDILVDIFSTKEKAEEYADILNHRSSDYFNYVVPRYVK